MYNSPTTMYRTACKAPLRCSPRFLLLQYQSQPRRYLKTRQKAIARGISSELGQYGVSHYEKDSNQGGFHTPNRKPMFSPTFSINKAPYEYKDIELPAIREEAYPDSNVSTTSPYTPPSLEERSLARTQGDGSSAPPPVATPAPRRSGDRPAPRLDRRGDRNNILAPPRMNIRRHIPRVALDSEFIYGTSVVTAAITSHRRKLYRLYVYSGPERTQQSKARDKLIKQLARKHHPELEIVDEPDMGQLNSMSDSWPHNGYVLDAGKLQKVPILMLGKVDEGRTEFGIVIAQHTTNPDMRLNKQPRSVKCRTEGRNPLVLMLDGILDPMNLGAIIRSAYYLGVEAIILPGRNSAPLAGTSLKAASGAAEYIPIYEITNRTAFMLASKNNGWKFYAAVPPPTEDEGMATKVSGGKKKRYLDETKLGGALSEAPCCLILGQEGHGMRPYMVRDSDYKVGISRRIDTDPLIDSLNVSVAAAILCNRFINPGPESLHPKLSSERELQKKPEGKKGPGNQKAQKNSNAEKGSMAGLLSTSAQPQDDPKAELPVNSEPRQKLASLQPEEEPKTGCLPEHLESQEEPTGPQPKEEPKEDLTSETLEFQKELVSLGADKERKQELRPNSKEEAMAPQSQEEPKEESAFEHSELQQEPTCPQAEGEPMEELPSVSTEFQPELASPQPQEEPKDEPSPTADLPSNPQPKKSAERGRKDSKPKDDFKVEQLW